MKEITMKSMLVWYGISIVAFTVTIMVIAQLVVTTMIGVTASLLLVPLISSMISIKIAIGKKKVRIIDEYKRRILITNIIAFAVAYWLVFEINILILALYIVGVIFAHLYSSKKISNAVEGKIATEKMGQVGMDNSNTSTIVETDSSNGLIKQYKLAVFNDASVREFLTMNHLNGDNYVFASLIPGMTSTFLFGSLASLAMTNYIIVFDDSKIYMFELSKLSNKVIEDCMTVEISTIKAMKTKSVVFGIAKRITIEFENKERITLQMNKKVAGLKEQTEVIERISRLV